jgi:hypothetical protein
MSLATLLSLLGRFTNSYAILAHDVDSRGKPVIGALLHESPKISLMDSLLQAVDEVVLTDKLLE